jgi:transposase-like protein
LDNSGIINPVVGLNFRTPLALLHPMPRPPYTAEERQQAIARALAPHTTIAQVAREIGCAHDTIHRWLRQHRQQEAPSTAPQGKATFIPVNIVDVQGHPVEIVAPNGIIIRLMDASPRYIAELLHILASC